MAQSMAGEGGGRRGGRHLVLFPWAAVWPYLINRVTGAGGGKEGGVGCVFLLMSCLIAPSSERWRDGGSNSSPPHPKGGGRGKGNRRGGSPDGTRTGNGTRKRIPFHIRPELQTEDEAEEEGDRERLYRDIIRPNRSGGESAAAANAI